jgi:hypothetical protein
VRRASDEPEAQAQALVERVFGLSRPVIRQLEYPRPPGIDECRGRATALLLAFCALLVAGAAIFYYMRLRSEDTRGKVQATVVGEICSTNVLQEVVAIYPQASMTKDQLGKMTVGEGLEKLKSFQAKLPTVLYPTALRLHTSDPSTWGYLVNFGHESVAAARSGKGRELRAFITDIITSAKQRCPDKISDRYSEFAVGAMVGYFGTQSSP